MFSQVLAAVSFIPDSAKVYLSVGGILMCVLTFSFGAGPVPSLLLSEIFPGRIRAKAMAICMAVHWVISSLFFFCSFIECELQDSGILLNSSLGYGRS
nr:probable plastidic glucose transporter 2 [Ipomoea batatas]